MTKKEMIKSIKILIESAEELIKENPDNSNIKSMLHAYKNCLKMFEYKDHIDFFNNL